MKLIVAIFILSCLFIGCKNKELPSKYLSNISVVRETETNVSRIPTTTPSNPAVSSPTQLHSKTSKYHIIVSSFGANEKARAEKLVSQLKAKNYPATLIFSSQRYRVSIESFPTESEANAARDEYRASTDRQDIWVHKVE